MSDAQEILPGAFEAFEDVIYNFERYRDAPTPIVQANYLVKLNDAMSDLRSFHPGYDGDHDTMPWDREED